MTSNSSQSCNSTSATASPRLLWAHLRATLWPTCLACLHAAAADEERPPRRLAERGRDPACDATVDANGIRCPCTSLDRIGPLSARSLMSHAPGHSLQNGVSTLKAPRTSGCTQRGSRCSESGRMTSISSHSSRGKAGWGASTLPIYSEGRTRRSTCITATPTHRISSTCLLPPHPVFSRPSSLLLRLLASSPRSFARSLIFRVCTRPHSPRRADGARADPRGLRRAPARQRPRQQRAKVRSPPLPPQRVRTQAHSIHNSELLRRPLPSPLACMLGGVFVRTLPAGDPSPILAFPSPVLPSPSRVGMERTTI